jgi:hypothetical protein
MVSDAERRRIQAGDELTVTIGASKYPAIVTDVRGERIFVKINPESDAPIETFYHWEDLFGPRERPVAAKFEITKDKAGKFRFHLKAANGEIIAASTTVVDRVHWCSDLR